MSKFLEILEQHDPANADNKNATIAATWFLYDKEIQFSSKGNKITLRTPEGDVVMEVLGIKQREVMADAEEDNQEIDHNTMADKISQRYKEKPLRKRMANTLTNSGEKQVDKAVNDRAKVYPEVAKAVKNDTKQLKKSLADRNKNFQVR